MLITLEVVRDTWEACYTGAQLAALYDRPLTPVEVLTRVDGAWATVPIHHRFDTVLRVGGISDRILQHFACGCASMKLSSISKPDPRSLSAVAVARRFINGEATREELHAAYTAAAQAAADAEPRRGPYPAHVARAAASAASAFVASASTLALAAVDSYMLTPAVVERQRDLLVSLLRVEL